MTVVQPLDPHVRVEVVGAMETLPEPVRERVEAIWREETAESAQLFNGALFSVETVSAGRIGGRMSEYRRFIAQQRDPALRAILNVRPLGVTGVHKCRDGLVLCRRSDEVALLPGQWETSPSGAVDDQYIEDGAVDLRAQLVAELVEETGIDATVLQGPPMPFGLVEDDRTGIIDVGFLIRSALSEADVREAFAARRTTEYSEVAVVPAGQIEALLPELNEISRALVKAATAHFC